jgi:cryptochrome
MWLSASCFFYQYFRVYSPIAFGKKTDKNGDYIRKWVPELKNYPAKFIYEPWLAPLAVQTAANCIVGRHYPPPIVDHATVSKTNMGWMAEAYARHNQSKPSGSFAEVQEREIGSEQDQLDGDGKKQTGSKRKATASKAAATLSKKLKPGAQKSRTSGDIRALLKQS